MKNQSINLAYNAQAQKFYIVINNVDSDDPIKTALTALIQGITGAAEVKPVEGLELTKTNADTESTVPENTGTEEVVSKNFAAEDAISENITTESVAEETAEAKTEATGSVADEEKSNPNDAAEIPFPEALPNNDNSAPVEGVQPENKQEEPVQAAVIFKLKPGVRCVGAIVKRGAATLNRKEGTIVTTDAQAISELEKAGLEKIDC